VLLQEPKAGRRMIPIQLNASAHALSVRPVDVVSGRQQPRREQLELQWHPQADVFAVWARARKALPVLDRLALQERLETIEVASIVGNPGGTRAT
jgi:hypothetical protein